MITDVSKMLDIKMGNAEMIDANEYWNFVIIYDENFYHRPIGRIYDYLTYKGYSWIHLKNNNWSIEGLYPSKKIKKLQNINPTYRILGHDYKLSELLQSVTHDTYVVYKIIVTKGIYIIDLIRFRYKYIKPLVNIKDKICTFAEKERIYNLLIIEGVKKVTYL